MGNFNTNSYNHCTNNSNNNSKNHYHQFVVNNYDFEKKNEKKNTNRTEKFV